MDNVLIVDFDKMVKDKYPQLTKEQVEIAGKFALEHIEKEFVPIFNHIADQGVWVNKFAEDPNAN